jgi:hypothetical protein
MCLTGAADARTLLRLVQSVPSARAGYERIKETADPEIALNRLRELRKKHGRPAKRTEQRMLGRETRIRLTGYWKDHEVREGMESAVLNSIIHEERAGLSVREHKSLKGLKTRNLRCRMSGAELIFTSLA